MMKDKKKREEEERRRKEKACEEEDHLFQTLNEKKKNVIFLAETRTKLVKIQIVKKKRLRR